MKISIKGKTTEDSIKKHKNLTDYNAYDTKSVRYEKCNVHWIWNFQILTNYYSNSNKGGKYTFLIEYKYFNKNNNNKINSEKQDLLVPII